MPKWTTVAIREEQAILLKAIQLKTGKRDDKPTRIIEGLVKRSLKQKLNGHKIDELLKALSKAEGQTYDHLDFSDYK